MRTPNCQHCKRPMKVNKYQKVNRGQEVYTFACYDCRTANVQTVRA